jgi:hypothetical protein
MKLFQLLLATALLLVCTHGFAGAFNPAPVAIDLDGQVAEGNLIAARFSANEAERIGCAAGYGNGHYAYCEASLGDGIDAFCITHDPVMIDTIASINTFSYVYFQWDDEGICTHVTVATRSIHIPEKIEMEMELFD